MGHTGCIVCAVGNLIFMCPPTVLLLDGLRSFRLPNGSACICIIPSFPTMSFSFFFSPVNIPSTGRSQNPQCRVFSPVAPFGKAVSVSSGDGCNVADSVCVCIFFPGSLGFFFFSLLDFVQDVGVCQWEFLSICEVRGHGCWT